MKERVKNNPVLARTTKSILCRIAHGSKPIPKDDKGKRIIKDYTLETELPMNVGVTCVQATESYNFV